ncbi:RHS repeat-associated core domain-containing protein [Clostridium estertheticum]|uniref:RHS repeat-associated core domain-containing protein n=1 Tax=Clostridium estertheticum TaxID=238834 RepID=A0A5N7IV33_9CLOT|nr:RHS repeat-associated core domain-containing protein [Clostridium estertheticum]MPQ64900.1 RHS repeat-associated core domain-containing protein [Clostridium estertheticum]
MTSNTEENRYYYTQDEQGSTVYITDKEQRIKNKYCYDAFGNVLDSREEVHNRITYTGQQFDGITQQYYLRARFYNPVIGRFTQEDVYRGDGLNLYAYCGSNPVGYCDPSGYEMCPPGNNKETSINKGIGEVVPKKTSFGDVIRKLNEPVEGIGTYNPTGGHHIYSKAAFRGHPKYDPDTAMTLSQKFMSDNGWTHHPDMAIKQRQLFDELYESGDPNIMSEHTRIAVESLQAGGATLQEARSLTAKALWDLRKQGVTYPTRIPWHK